MALTPEQRLAQQQQILAQRNAPKATAPVLSPTPDPNSFVKNTSPTPTPLRTQPIATNSFQSAIQNVNQDFDVRQPIQRMAPTVPTPQNPVTTFGAAPKTEAPTAKDVFIKRATGKQLEDADYGVIYDEMQKQFSPATLKSTGYQSQIDLANKQAAEAQAGMDEKKRLIMEKEMAARNLGESNINSVIDQQVRSANEQGTNRINAQQAASSFSGFGRSTANAGKIDEIGKTTANQVQTLEASRAAQKTLLDAQLRGASAEELEGLSANVAKLQKDAKDLEIKALGEIAKLNQENGVKGAEAMANVFKTLSPQSAAEIDASASKGVGYLIKKNGTPVLGADGKPIKFAEADSSSYTGDVGQWQQALKSGAIPQGTSFDQFNAKYGASGSSSGSGVSGTGAGGNFTEAQKALLSTIDPNNITSTTTKLLAEAGLSVSDLGQFLATEKKQLSPDKKADIENILQSINNLSTMGGLKNAVGFGWQKAIPEMLGGGGEEAGFIEGSAAENFRKEFLSFRDRLVLPSLDKLKGAMSDKDIQFLRNAATALSLSQSEEQFKATLDSLKNTYQTILNGSTVISSEQKVQQYLSSLPLEEKARLGEQFKQALSSPIFENAEEEDIYKYLIDKWKIDSGGSFNSVGSDTHAAAPLPPKNGVEAWKTLFGVQSAPTTVTQAMKDISNVVPDSLKKFAANCVFFARQIVPNIPTGATSVAGRKEGLVKAQKEGYGGTDMSKVKVGDAIHTTEGDVGHTAVVIGMNGNNLILKEANYKSGKVTEGRQIRKNDPKILGWISPTTKKVQNNSNEGVNPAIDVQMKLFGNYS